MSSEQYVTIDREELARLRADSAELARVRAELSSGVDFGFDDRSVRVTQEAYSIFMAREESMRSALSFGQATEGFALVPVEVKRDAERWQAFINCARIKLFGWAGYTNPDPNGNDPKNYRHFGGEFWTIHDAPTTDKEKAREILNGFADAAIAAAPKGDSHE